jgi:putative molybdopterin biosynthesis protein
MKRRYLSLQTRSDALTLMKNAFLPAGGSVIIPLAESEGRVASDPIYARYTVPDSSIAEMDGIAVKSSDTNGAGERHPVTITDFVRVDTGNIVPQKYDAVIVIEEVQLDGPSCVIRKSARPGQCIRPPGQDIRNGDLIIPRGHQIRSSDISALATYGYDHITVRVVRIGIIPVGNELVPLGTPPGPGQVIESNSIFAASFLSRLGALCTRYGMVHDNPEEIEKSLNQAVSENDLVLISSGTSAGRHDYTAETISRLGRLIFHGVAILPGKPAMLGDIGGKPVVGLPGYPVGSQTALRELVAPMLVSWGLAPVPEWIIPGRLARDMPSELGFDEYIPVSVGSVNGCAWVFPHPRGSGLQMNMVRANGYLHIPRASEGWEAGGWADIHCTSLPQQIERTLLCIGAKNPGVALLADTLADNAVILHTFEDLPARALLTLQKNSCNLVAVHIPGINPVPEMYHELRNLPAVSIHIGRMQVGIISRSGAGLADLTRVRLINSPTGSTGRMIIDQLLSAQEIHKNQIRGNLHEVKSEYAVVSAVRNGIADAGICSFAYAVDSGLPFVPVMTESHDIVIRKESLDDQRVQTLLRVVRSLEFKSRLQTKCWYTTTWTGRVRDVHNEVARDTHSGQEGSRSPDAG